jgi:hypothetical protein
VCFLAVTGLPFTACMLISFPDRQEIRREAADSAVTAKAEQQQIVLIWKGNNASAADRTRREQAGHQAG